MRLYTNSGPDNPFLRQGATWMRMHVSDPPTMTSVSYHMCSHQVGIGQHFKTNSHSNGLRMAELYSAVIKWTVLQSETQSFRVLWPENGTVNRRHVACATGQSIGEFDPPLNSDGFEVLAKANAQLLLDFHSMASCMLSGNEEDIGVYQQAGFAFFHPEFASCAYSLVGD